MREAVWFCVIVLGLMVVCSIVGFFTVKSPYGNRTLTGGEAARLFMGWFIVMGTILMPRRENV